MELQSSRLTRAASARLGQTLHDSGESTIPWLKSDWGRSILDAKISRRLGVQTTKKNAAVAEMAPGGNLNKKKVLFTANRTSFFSASRNLPIVEFDRTKELTPVETVLASIHRTTSPPAPSSGNQAKSNGGETQSTGRQNKSTAQQSQSPSPLIQSVGNKTQRSSRQNPSTVYKKITNSPKGLNSVKDVSATPTEPTGLQNDAINHLANETTETTEDASHDGESDETVALPSSGPKRKRGPTMGKGLMKAMSGSNGKKLKIEVDPAIGRPKNRVQSAKFSSEVGVVDRDVLPIPKKWKEVDMKTALEPALDHMQIHMELNMDTPGVKETLIERIKNNSRQQRHRLHNHFKRFRNVEEAKCNKPKSVTDQEQLELFCDHFDSPKFKNQSRANKKNRMQMKAKHVTGRTPFTVIQNEITIKNGKDCDVIELYQKIHQNPDGNWSSTAAEDNWELMKASQQKYADEGVQITKEEIAAEVLCPANGYIKGRGYGPKPSRKSSVKLQQQLHDTQTELEEAKPDNAAYKTKVDAMNEQLSQQAEQIAQLMAFMGARGRSVIHEDEDDDAI